MATSNPPLQLQFSNQLASPPKLRPNDVLGAQQALAAMDQYGQNNFMTGVGPYWSGQNAEFEKTNPNLLDRAARSLNPMSGLGSAAGAMHDAVGKGSAGESFLAALQAWPMFAGLKAAASTGVNLSKAPIPPIRQILDLQKTLKYAGIGTAGSVGIDETQAQGNR